MVSGRPVHTARMHTNDTQPRLEPLADGVWAWVQPDGTWWVNNAGVIAGDDGLLVVDTCATEQRTRRFLDEIARTAPDSPIRWAVNTHEHGDHSYGNSLLPAETVLFGHEHMRSALATDPMIDGCPPFWSPVPDWGNVVRRVPSVTFRSELSVHVGGRTVELRHPGHSAHTGGDVVAWLPEERVLFSGDLLFHGLTPLVFMGSPAGAARALDWIAEFEPRRVVPGHGPVIEAADLPGVLAEHERYYRLVLDLAKSGVDAGIPPLEAAQDADLGEFADWADAERIVANLHRAYADLTGTSPDVAAALRESVAWRGALMETSVNTA